MVPETTVNITELEMETQPSRTYRLDINSRTISGVIDGQDAILQAVHKILNTERYANVIYSSEYGVELERLIGQDFDFIVSDLERTIVEALTVDDRIQGIENFTATRVGLDKLDVTFTVVSIIGAVDINVEVQII